MIAFAVIAAVILDVLMGEPKRWHPLVGFGYLANAVEKYFNLPARNRFFQFLLGAFSWFLLVILPVILFIILLGYVDQVLGSMYFLEVVVLYLSIGYTSLRQHAMAVVDALLKNDLDHAREKVGMIVSRDIDKLDEENVCKAAIESVLENGSDAIFAPIFWFVIGGAPAVIIYRLSNTLDAMWGYKTKRFLYFGRFSARMDDILNWMPSRLVGFSYLLLGNSRSALKCWLGQARLLDSPSAGVVMTSGAGALQVLLGGDARYHGELKTKPIFGCGRRPGKKDIQRSLGLINKTVCFWCFIVLAASLLYFYDLYNQIF